LYVTVDVDRKLLPLRVRVNAPAPTVEKTGEKLVRLGAGLLTGKLSVEFPPPGVGFVTTTA
jgi:hypothetical protein